MCSKLKIVNKSNKFERILNISCFQYPVNKNTRKRRKIFSKLIITTPERLQGRHSGVIIVNFEQFFLVLFC